MNKSCVDHFIFSVDIEDAQSEWLYRVKSENRKYFLLCSRKIKLLIAENREKLISAHLEYAPIPNGKIFN